MLKEFKLLHPDAEVGVEKEEMALDDARRVKVLSPSMMVFKRFVRNKLAIIGFIIIVIMFLFSFVGPVFSPYDRDQVFTQDTTEWKSYATAQYNAEARFLYAPGQSASNSLQSAVLFALGENRSEDGKTYELEQGQMITAQTGGEQCTVAVINPDPTRPTLVVFPTKVVAKYAMRTLTVLDATLPESTVAALQNYCDTNSKETTFEVDGMTVYVSGDKMEKQFSMTSTEPTALATYNVYSAMLGKTAELQADVAFMAEADKAVKSGAASLTYNGETYTLTKDETFGGTYLVSPAGENLFLVTEQYIGSQVSVTQVNEETGEEEDVMVDFVATIEDADGFKAAFAEAAHQGLESFTFAEVEYTVDYTEDPAALQPDGQLAMTLSNSFDAIESEEDLLFNDFGFVLLAETAIANGETTFTYNGGTYTLTTHEQDTYVQNAAGENIILVSDIIMGTSMVGIDLTVDFRLNLQDAMRNGEENFTFVNQYGEEAEARVRIVNSNFYVDTVQEKTLFLTNDAPSKEHILGTDGNGMDVMTRLMYGGQISLLVGFIVIIFELVIGIIIGGISGYFGGWVDTLLMRFVDLFNALPFYPIVIIFGSLMDELRVDGWTRIMIMMAIIGILGWTGTARVVRGQILSLREQDFMVATEATGIRTGRRIFRHLVPNVMPLLIVQATMGLGGIILTEATLGYLGLGVKYPMASWGAIINQATDMYIMTTAWWIWIPAGVLILLTVLGFNFVGDGLRDAFDPKMKR